MSPLSHNLLAIGLLASMLLLSRTLMAQGEQMRLEACLKNYSKLAKKYFVLNAQDACPAYAKVEVRPELVSCVENILGKSAANRDYYINYGNVVKLCGENPNMPKDMMNCMSAKLANGGDTIAVVWKCSPEYIQCQQKLERLFAVKNTQHKKFYQQVCVRNSSDSAFIECMANKAKELKGRNLDFNKISTLCVSI